MIILTKLAARLPHRLFGASVVSLMLGTAVAQAQVQIPASFMASPSDYNIASTNFVMKVYQTVTNSPNTIQGAQDRLAGVYGPNIATNGPNADGSYTVPYIDHDVADAFFTPGDPLFFPGANNLPYPGIDNTAGAGTNVTVEVVGYLKLPAGVHTLGVRANDTFRLTIGVGKNPYDAFAIQPAGGVRSPGGNAQDNLFSFQILSAGVYPIRLVHGQGAGAGTIELYYTNKSAFGPGFGTYYLINDPADANNSDTIVSFAPASLPIVPTQAYVASITPAPGAVNVSPLPLVTAQLVDSGTTVDTNTISLSVNGSPVSPLSITKVGAVTTVSGQVTNLLASSQTVPLSMVFQDSAATVISNSLTFQVVSYFAIAAGSGYPLGSGNALEPGFIGRTHLARKNAQFNASVAVANARLRDELIDPLTSLPWENLVQTAVSNTGDPDVILTSANGGYINTNVINYSCTATTGVPLADGSGGGNGTFTNDNRFPGMPAWDDSTRTVASNTRFNVFEEIAWLELPAGLIEIGVFHRDAAQIATHPNDVRDIFRDSVVIFDTNAGYREDRRTMFVEQAGLYGFRVVQTEFDDGPAVEFFTVDAAGNRHLVNDLSNTNSIKAYRSLNVPTRPYITAVSPGVGQSGVSQSATVSVVFQNLGANIPVLKVNGSPVAYNSNTVGSQTTISYNASFPPFTQNTVEVQYTGLSESWVFQTQSGLRALVCGIEKPVIAQRLAFVHGLDVDVLDAAVASALPVGDLLKYEMVWNSEAVASAAAAGLVQKLRYEKIPAINVEQGNANAIANGWYLFSGSGNKGSGNRGQVVITNAASPLAGGLPAGTNTILTGSLTTGTWHGGGAGAINNTASSVLVIGHAVDDTTQNPMFAWPAGTMMPFLGTNGVDNFITPAKRVQFCIAGPGMIDNWNTNAFALFDAAVEWVLPLKFRPPFVSGTNLTLSWIGNGTLQSTTNLASPTWVDEPSQANPQSVPLSIPQKYFRLRE